MENNINYWLEKLNCNQKKLSQLLGITEQHISNNWKRKGIPQKYIPQLEKLATEITTNYNNSVVNNGNNFGNMQYGVDNPKTSVATQTEELKPVIPTKLYKQPDTHVAEWIAENQHEIRVSPTIQQFAEFTFFYEVVGESMAPEFKPSDALALQRLERPFRIFNGEIYAVDTKRGVIVRMLYENGQNYIARAFNPRFADTEILASEIYDIYRVVGLVRKNI